MQPRAKVLRNGSRGYSLVEMLVVVAVIGIISLVTIPNFVTMYRASRLTSSMRQVANDLRYARQLAVTRRTDVRVTYRSGVGQRGYQVVQRDPGTTSWSVVKSRDVEQTCSLQSGTNFTDLNSDSKIDIQFGSNGGAFIPGGSLNGTLLVTTTSKVPKPSYTITVLSTGSVTTGVTP